MLQVCLDYIPGTVCDIREYGYQAALSEGILHVDKRSEALLRRLSRLALDSLWSLNSLGAFRAWRSLGPLRALNPLRSLRPLDSLWAFRAWRSLGSLRALRSWRSFSPCQALRAYSALCSGSSRRTLWPCRALRSLRSWRSLRPLRALGLLGPVPLAAPEGLLSPLCPPVLSVPADLLHRWDPVVPEGPWVRRGLCMSRSCYSSRTSPCFPAHTASSSSPLSLLRFATVYFLREINITAKNLH